MQVPGTSRYTLALPKTISKGVYRVVISNKMDDGPDFYCIVKNIQS